MVRSPAADTVQIRWPPPRSRQAGSRSRAARTCAMTLTCHEAFQSASLACSPAPRAIPAFAQNRSISPSTSRATPTSAATPPSVAASPGTAVAPHAVATAAAAAASMSLTTTRAPSAANLRASAAPMPLPAPVTTTPAPLTDSIPASLLRVPWLRQPRACFVMAAPAARFPRAGCHVHPPVSLVAGQVEGDGESRVGGQQDRSAQPGRPAGPQDERGQSGRYRHGREFDRPEAEGKRREGPRDEGDQGYHQAGDLGA